MLSNSLVNLIAKGVTAHQAALLQNSELVA